MASMYGRITFAIAVADAIGAEDVAEVPESLDDLGELGMLGIWSFV
jgi:hypothetical protein